MARTATKTETEKTKTASRAKKASAAETEKKPRATRTKKIEEPAAEPEFASIKEELAWLKKKKSLTDFQKMRLEFLEKPVTVIGEKIKNKTAKKAKKRKPKPAVLHENGEYVETPTTFTKLKSYITTYVRAVGWKDKKFKFPDCKYLGFKDFKVTGDKDKKEVYITGNLIFQSPSQMLSKPFSKTFTLENYRDIRSIIKNTYREVEKNWKGLSEADDAKLSRKGWCRIY